MKMAPWSVCWKWINKLVAGLVHRGRYSANRVLDVGGCIDPPWRIKDAYLFQRQQFFKGVLYVPDGFYDQSEAVVVLYQAITCAFCEDGI